VTGDRRLHLVLPSDLTSYTKDTGHATILIFREEHLARRSTISTMPVDKHIGASHEPDELAVQQRRASLAETSKTFWERLWPVIACGAGLFSDGYLNNVIGSVSTILKGLYPKSYGDSPAISNVSSITFVGQVVGQLVFGWTSDHWSRKWSLFISTMILLLFAILCTGAYGAGGSASGLFAALTGAYFDR
jgi:hypothetical protein